MPQWKFTWIPALFLLIVGFAALDMAISLQSLSTNWIESIGWVQINTVASLFLSAVLAYFYYSMRNVQDRQASIANEQTQILERQTEIAAAAHTPNIRFDEWSNPTKGAFAIEVRNTGNGIAKNLRFTSILLVDNPMYQTVPMGVSVRADHVDVPGRPVDLEPGESSEIKAQLQFRLKGTGRFGDSITSFPAVIRKLYHTGSRVAELRVGLTYDDITGETSGERIASARFMLPSGHSIENALTMGGDSAISAPWNDERESTAHFNDLQARPLRQTNPPKAKVHFDVRRPVLDPFPGTISVKPLRLSGVKIIQSGEKLYETEIDSNSDETIEMGIGSEREIELNSEDALIEVIGEYDGEKRTVELIAVPDRHPDTETHSQVKRRIFTKKRQG